MLSISEEIKNFDNALMALIGGTIDRLNKESDPNTTEFSQDETAIMFGIGGSLAQQSYKFNKWLHDSRYENEDPKIISIDLGEIMNRVKRDLGKNDNQQNSTKN